MLKIGIIFGGKSGEHEISLMSATSVINAIDKEKYKVVPIGITKEGAWLLYDGPIEGIEEGTWQKYAETCLKGEPDKYKLEVLAAGGKSLKDIIDFAFPILHGPNGEDGTIQGLFELVGIPYAGCGVLASSTAMDKCMAKELFAKAGLPICKHLTLQREEIKEDVYGVINKIEEALEYPVFVKPANMGSSVGITKARNRSNLRVALDEACLYDRRLIIEETVVGREIEVGVIGNYGPKASAIGEIVASQEFYDYTAKYFDGGRSKTCIPADFDNEISEEVKQVAIKAYETLNCSGFARIDFFVENDTNRVIISEINTIPGFTKFSMFPLLWECAGVIYSELIERIIDFGYERHNAENNRQTD